MDNLSNILRRIGPGLLAFTCAATLLSRALPPAAVTFTDVVPAAGITFVHDNAWTPEKYLIESMGAGCAWIDYDQDGLMDLYLVNGAATKIYTPKQTLRSALYRNKGDGTFTDVTQSAGVGAEGLFGMGVAVGDYDNDGFPDLYVLGYDRCILYHNNSQGAFTDVTASAKVENRGLWASSAAWFDYDNDSRLDLIIANYVDWTPERNFYCGDQGPEMRSYCHPNVFHGQPARLYHNNGDGTFTDASQSSAIGPKAANGLGVVTFDYNNDGWQDIFISNDAQPNHLFHNKGDGTFREIAYMAGAAVGGDGQMEAGMGVDAADTTNTGLLDIYITHLDLQLNRFYRNMGDGSYTDASLSSKLGNDTYNVSGFGTRFMDYDNDGLCDLFVANGNVMDNVELYHPNTTYAVPKQMFRNIGRGKFENVSKKLGPDMEKPHVSRGCATGDFDNDGDLDVLVSGCGQKPQLFRNDGGNANHWLEILLVGTKSNRDGVGARVRVSAGDLAVYDQRKGGMSYQSAQDPRLFFGLGEHAAVDTVEITWPSKQVTRLEKLKSDQIITVKEGVGIIERPFPHVQAK